MIRLRDQAAVVILYMYRWYCFVLGKSLAWAVNRLYSKRGMIETRSNSLNDYLLRSHLGITHRNEWLSRHSFCWLLHECFIHLCEFQFIVSFLSLKFYVYKITIYIIFIIILSWFLLFGSLKIFIECQGVWVSKFWFLSSCISVVSGPHCIHYWPVCQNWI